jgi:hypothetical protein
MKAKEVIEALGGRKFIYSVVALIAGMIALATGKLDGSEWVTLAIGLGGFYGVSNALTHRAHSSASPELTPPLREEMEDVGH